MKAIWHKYVKNNPNFEKRKKPKNKIMRDNQVFLVVYYYLRLLLVDSRLWFDSASLENKILLSQTTKAKKN
jgi:hypothetical protein